MAIEYDFGPVLIKRGEYEGVIGYYDDDEFENNKLWAVVYLAPVPFTGPYILLDYKDVEPVSSDETERYINDDPIKSAVLRISNR